MKENVPRAAAISCPACGDAKPSLVPGCVACGYIDTTLLKMVAPHRSVSPTTVSSGARPILPSRPSPDIAVIAAAVLFFGMGIVQAMYGLILVVSGLLQVVTVDTKIGASLCMLGIVFAIIGWWIIQRDRRGYHGGMAGAGGFAVWGTAIFLLIPSAFFAMKLWWFVVPICFITLPLLWNSQDAFIDKSSTTSGPRR